MAFETSSSRRRPPMLYLPMAPLHDHRPRSARLYSVPEARIYSNVESLVLDKTRVYCGHGWVAELKFHHEHGIHVTVSITLVNHFGKSRETIPLPSLVILPNLNYRVEDDFRCNLYADPILDMDNYVVITQHDCEAYIIKGGDQQKCWKRIDLGLLCSNPPVTYYKGRVYTIYNYSDIATYMMAFDLNTSRMTYSIISKPSGIHDVGALCFVESTKGDLLVVKRIMKSSWTTGFKVYKLELEESNYRGLIRLFEVNNIGIYRGLDRLVEVNNIGDEALFVGENQSLSVLASRFPKCMPNCIYYTCSRHSSTELDGDDDVGIFNLQDGSITQLCPQSILEGLKSHAVWITSSFPVE